MDEGSLVQYAFFGVRVPGGGTTVLVGVLAVLDAGAEGDGCWPWRVVLRSRPDVRRLFRGREAVARCAKLDALLGTQRSQAGRSC